MAMYRVIKVFLKLILVMASMVVMSSANCSDPGIPRHGSRTVVPSGRFFDGITITFSCNTFYTLTGAKKILCIKGRWNGKRPICQPSGCPLPTPDFPNARLKNQSLQNTKGSYVEYTCNAGYTSNGRPTKILCDKDHDSQGYIWNGNITCEKIRCGRPPRIAHGYVTTGPHLDGARTMATYYCFSGYKLLDYNRKQQPLFRMSCEEGTGGGVWRAQYVPKCVKTCRTSDVKIDHGYVNSNPTYKGSYNFTENMTANFFCKNHYKLEGYQVLRCMESGLWSAKAPRCVINICKSPGEIGDGFVTFNHTKTDQTNARPIWTEASYKCKVGFKLIGTKTRQCQPGGHWSGQRNPFCNVSTLTCKKKNLPNGEYKPSIGKYSLNQIITPYCDSGFLLWGPPSLICKDLNDHEYTGEWVYLGCKGNHEPYCDDTKEPKCVTPEEFAEKCQKVDGHATTVLKKGKNSMFCETSTVEEPDVPDETQQPNRELDKMTIVIASTGSTLGALVVLLAALYCFRQRIRRIRRPSYRSRRYSDDDRIAFIAYAGDVHFILPSYDEAISQVERSPPSFESVVEGTQGSANRSTTDSNGNQNTNQSGHTGLNHTAANTNRATEDDDLRTDQELAQGQSIRIVSNPLANNGRDTICSSTTQNADHASSSESERRVGFSDEHACLNARGKESSPNRPSEDISSCSSEEDLTSNQTQPLLSNSRRGVRM